MDEDHARKLYLDYRLQAEQAKKIRKFVEETTESINQIKETIRALEQFERVPAGAPVLASIANGIFVETTLRQCGEVKMNVGGSIVVSQTIAQACALLQEQQATLERVCEHASKDLAEAAAKLKAIETMVE